MIIELFNGLSFSAPYFMRVSGSGVYRNETTAYTCHGKALEVDVVSQPGGNSGYYAVASSGWLRPQG